MLPQHTAEVIREVFDANLLLAKLHIHQRSAHHLHKPMASTPSTTLVPIAFTTPETATKATITIDDRDFDVDSISPEATQQMDMVVACDDKLRDL